MQSVYLTATLALLWIVFLSGRSGTTDFTNFKTEFIRGYQELGVPEVSYDYRQYFNSIAPEPALVNQKQFFARKAAKLKQFDHSSLSPVERIEYEHLLYEISFNLYRVGLEQDWVKGGRQVPEGGLYNISDRKDWYQYFIKKFTSTDLTAEEVFALGKKEVARVSGEIEKIRQALKFPDSKSFYAHLKHDSFFIKDKREIIAGFGRIDSLVRTKLADFVSTVSVPPIYAMEWPGADPTTPPGIYLNRSNTAYGKDVFQFNFSTGRYNKRAMEWLYMHEAIPGHHLQSTISQRTELQQLFLYPGNFEGWGCYVEYWGKDLGLYQDPYSYLGKWEWDLVRSARLVLDAGIHYYGWTRKEALDYWKATIPGQDDIAEREITRVTNWCGQALSYKVGAAFITDLKKEWMEQHKGSPIHEFHMAYLQSGLLPLTVLKKHLLA